jgi:hypothetical protein
MRGDQRPSPAGAQVTASAVVPASAETATEIEAVPPSAAGGGAAESKDSSLSGANLKIAFPLRSKKPVPFPSQWLLLVSKTVGTDTHVSKLNAYG